MKSMLNKEVIINDKDHVAPDHVWAANKEGIIIDQSIQNLDMFMIKLRDNQNRLTFVKFLRNEFELKENAQPAVQMIPENAVHVAKETFGFEPVITRQPANAVSDESIAEKPEETQTDSELKMAEIMRDALQM